MLLFSIVSGLIFKVSFDIFFDCFFLNLTIINPTEHNKATDNPDITYKYTSVGIESNPASDDAWLYDDEVDGTLVSSWDTSVFIGDSYSSESDIGCSDDKDWLVDENTGEFVGGLDVTKDDTVGTGVVIDDSMVEIADGISDGELEGWPVVDDGE